MEGTPYNRSLTTDFETNFQFSDIFDIEELQQLQDLFADAHGVASIITYPDGVPITNPSNFCPLCDNIVRNSEKGRANCYLSDKLPSKPGVPGPISPCLSCGLLDVGTSIIVGGKHIANWLIGQVRNNGLDKQQFIQYTDESGANKEVFSKAFNEVPVMSLVQFNKVANMLFAFANILSEKAYKNLQLKMQIIEHENAIALLQDSEENMRYTEHKKIQNEIIFHADLLNNVGQPVIAEAALKESERLLRESQAIARLGSFVWDLSTGLWKSSAILDEIFGIDEKYNRSLEGWASIVHSDWQKIMNEYVMNDVLGDLKKFDKEYQIVRQNDGQDRWVHGLAVLEFDYNNQPIRLIGTISDITERKQAEEKHKDSQALLRIAEEKARLGGWSVNLAENRSYWSDGVAAIHEMPPGYSPLVEDGINFYTPEWRDKMTKIFTDCAKEGIPYDEEMEIITAGGKRVWVRTIGEAVRDDKGKIVKVHGAFQDISERKRYEVSLRETNEYLENLFNYANAPIIVWDTEFKITRFNHAFEELSGYTADEVIGEIVDILFPKDKIESLHDLITKTACGARWESVEIEILRKDGDVRIVLWNSANILDQTESKIIATLAQGNDITDRKQAEEVLRKHSGRLQNLHMIDQAILQAIESPEAVVQTAIQHIRELLNCQRVSVGIFDLEKKEVLVYAADVDGKTIVQIGKVLTEEVYGVIDILRQSKIEIVEDMSIVASPSLVNMILQAEGIQSSINVALVSELEMYGVLNVGWEKSRTISTEETEIAAEVASQITIAIEKARLLKETKGYALELEQRVIRRTAQLEAANKEMEAFSYSVSHDLRAPLRHISGFAEMLSTDFKDQLPDNAMHYLDTINSSAKKMGNLIDDLLSFSRTGRAEMKKTTFNMNQVIEEAKLQVNLSIADRKIIWNIAILPEVFGDYNLLRLVWINLLENAVKYTKKRRKAILNIDCIEEKEEYIFRIRDNGVGFDMKYANKLFGVFQRLHSSADFEGTGIGLANIRRIILKHGGRTWAKARLNIGATFYFTLPKIKENNL